MGNLAVPQMKLGQDFINIQLNLGMARVLVTHNKLSLNHPYLLEFSLGTL